jgi:hypothetical protein
LPRVADSASSRDDRLSNRRGQGEQQQAEKHCCPEHSPLEATTPHQTPSAAGAVAAFGS